MASSFSTWVNCAVWAMNWLLSDRLARVLVLQLGDEQLEERVLAQLAVGVRAGDLLGAGHQVLDGADDGGGADRVRHGASSRLT